MNPVPMNRIAATAFCRHCLAVVELDPVWGSNLFARGWDASPTKWPLGKRDQSAPGNSRIAMDLEVEHVAPLPPGQPARGADALVARVFPGVARIYNEVAGGNPTAAPVEQPLLFACLQCGGSLKVDGTNRVVTCAYCNQANFLSDALWLRLHPVYLRRWLVLEYG